MGTWIFDTAAVLALGAVLLYAWRTRKNPPAPLTPLQRDRLTAIRSRGRTAYILRTGVLGYGLAFTIVKTILAYSGFNEWRQPELEPLARFGYWFVRMLPLNLLGGAVMGFFMWRAVEATRFHLLDDSPLSIGSPRASSGQTSSPRPR